MDFPAIKVSECGRETESTVESRCFGHSSVYFCWFRPSFLSPTTLASVGVRGGLPGPWVRDILHGFEQKRLFCVVLDEKDALLVKVVGFICRKTRGRTPFC